MTYATPDDLASALGTCASPQGDTLLAVKRENLAGSVRANQHIVNEAAPVNLVSDYGAVLDDTSAGARLANKSAFINAFADSDDVHIEFPGTLYLPSGANIEVPPGMTLTGCGLWGAGTSIIGDGDIFRITTGDNGRTFRDFFIANENSGSFGKLFYITLPAGVKGFEWNNVSFGQAINHVYVNASGSDCFAVDWLFNRCRFEFSTSHSRYFECGISALKDIACACAVNYRHLTIVGSADGNLTYGFSSSQSVYESASDAGLYFITAGGDIYSIDISQAHFEGNAGGDISLNTNSANHIHSCRVNGGIMTAPHASQPTRIVISEAGGGQVKHVSVSKLINDGSKKLAPNSNKVFVDNVILNGNSAESSWKVAQYV